MKFFIKQVREEMTQCRVIQVDKFITKEKTARDRKHK